MNSAEFRRFAEKAVQAAGIEGNPFVSLVYISDPEMTTLNMDALGHIGTTDVISFDLRIPGMPDCGSSGDCPDVEIYVCVDVAAREAAKRDLSFSRETALYTVHGLLHIAGEDDLSPVAKRKMRRAEKRVMKELSESFDLDTIFGNGPLPGPAPAKKTAKTKKIKAEKTEKD